MQDLFCLVIGCKFFGLQKSLCSASQQQCDFDFRDFPADACVKSQSEDCLGCYDVDLRRAIFIPAAQELSAVGMRGARRPKTARI
jgi:hypothetical protein